MEENLSSQGGLPSPHIVNPTSIHTCTIVMLHGRGSDGEEFAEEFLAESHLSDKTSLAEAFPGARWVFPSSKQLWSTAFEEHMPAWFEAHSLSDTTSRQDLQTAGIKDSVAYVQSILDDELAILEGRKEKLIMGGISQGGAIAMLTLLGRGGLTCGGAFVTNTWLPFAENIEQILPVSNGQAVTESAGEDDYDGFVQTLTSEFSGLGRSKDALPPIFFGHGVDDAYVDVSLGRQAREVLVKAGFSVDWREYSGAELEGHWYKVPEQMEDIKGFLDKLLGS